MQAVIDFQSVMQFTHNLACYFQIYLWWWTQDVVTRCSSIESAFDFRNDQYQRRLATKGKLATYRSHWSKSVPRPSLVHFYSELLYIGEFRDDMTGRNAVRATMTIKRFKEITRMLLFNNKNNRSERRPRDPFAPIREVLDKCAYDLKMMFNP